MSRMSASRALRLGVWLAALALPYASASHADAALSARHAGQVRQFYRVIGSSPPDSVWRWLDTFEPAAAADSGLRVVTHAERAWLLAMGGRYRSAVEAARPALDRGLATGDSLLACLASYPLWSAYALSEQVSDARPHADRLLALGRALKLPREEGRGHMAVAYLDLLAGRAEAAERGYRAALRRLDPALDVIPRRIARTGLSRACFSQGRVDEAMRIDISLVGDARREIDPVGESIALNNLAIHALASFEPAMALPCYRRSLALQRGMGRWSEALTTATNLADALVRMGRVDEAADVLGTLADTTRGDVRPWQRVDVLTQLAYVRWKQRRTDAATQLAEHAWRLCDSARVTPNTVLVSTRARLLAGAGRIDDALALADRFVAARAENRWTLDDVLSLRATAAGLPADAGYPEESLRRWLALERDVDTSAVANQGRWVNARLHVAALVTARDRLRGFAMLREAVPVWRRYQGSRPPSEWGDALDAGSAASWGAAAAAIVGSETDDALTLQTFELLQQVRALSLERRAADPRDEAPLTLARLRSDVLRDGELALDVHPAGDRTLVFAVTRRAVRARVVTDSRDLLDRADRLRTLARERSPEAAELRASVGREFSDVLLAPFADLLRGSRRLLVSSSGFVDEVPLAWLPRPGASARLGERVSIALVPTLATLARVRSTTAAAAARGPLVVAGATGPDRRALAGVVAERDWLGARYATATLRTPRREQDLGAVLAELPRADVIHLSAHFAADDDNPWRSGALLGDPAQDRSWLRASTVAPLRLRARLAVLAGCSSARGDEQGLIGHRGLASAFTLAGTRAVVGAQWDVSDAAGFEFVRRLYTALDEGNDVADAVASAQRGMATDARWTPADWAGFVVLGDPDVRIALPRRGFAGWPARALVGGNGR